MLDGLLKSKFQTKCKSLITMTKTRLDVLKKKKCSVVRFLKNDVADLLRSDLCENAYGRVQGLLVEQKMIACCDFMEKFCERVLTNLSTMDKQRECPEECKEAVQSLKYAAARIAELRELRDLRNIFTERYGSSLEPYINKEFVETLEPLPATRETKLQVLDEIAAEFNVRWDSRYLRVKLHSSSPVRDEEQPERESYNKSDHREGELVFRRRKNGSESSSSEDSSDQASSSSVGSASEDELDIKKALFYQSVPPPYVKPTAESETQKPPPKDDLVDKSKRRSVRRKPANSPGQENASSLERPLKPPPGREKFGAKTVKEEEKAADGDDDEEDTEEEKTTDDLWIRHGKAKPKVTWKTSNDGSDALSARKTKSELPAPPGRELYQEKAKKLHNRAVSEQPRALSSHVHPNLPDFDDLQARIAALRGR